MTRVAVGDLGWPAALSLLDTADIALALPTAICREHRDTNGRYCQTPWKQKRTSLSGQQSIF